MNSGGNTIKAALYVATATLNDTTTAYSATNEVSGTGYSAGGTTITNGTWANTGKTAYWTPGASFSWTTVTLSTSFDTVFLYNSTQSNKAISVHTFAAQTVNAANFTLTMPTNNSSTALLRITGP